MTGFLEATEVYREGQRTLPGHYYTSPEVYAVEQERIFAERWVCEGRAAEVSNPGDYVLRTIAGERVIVVRGRRGASTMTSGPTGSSSSRTTPSACTAP